MKVSKNVQFAGSLPVHPEVDLQADYFLILYLSSSRERLVHLLAVRAQKKMELHNRIYKGTISILRQLTMENVVF